MYRIQLRRGTAAQWIEKNPVLADGEPGYETDTRMYKVGNGISTWLELEYAASSSGASGDGSALVALTAHINASAPHPAYDDGPSLLLLYQNSKV